MCLEFARIRSRVGISHSSKYNANYGQTMAPSMLFNLSVVALNPNILNTGCVQWNPQMWGVHVIRVQQRNFAY